jgi:hypothetical protein
MIFARRRDRPIDLRFNQYVVWTADHDQVFDVVAPNDDKLPLSIETERIDEAQSRLPGSPAWHTQPVCEHESIHEGQNHQCGDSTGGQNCNLDDTLIAGEKIIQPLHAISKFAPTALKSRRFAFPAGDAPRSSSTGQNASE